MQACSDARRTLFVKYCHEYAKEKLARLGKPDAAEYHMWLLKAVIPDEDRGRYRLTGDHKARPAGTTWYEMGWKHMQLPKEFSEVSGNIRSDLFIGEKRN